MHITPIGVIHTPFTRSADAPIQPSAAGDTEGRVVVFDSYIEGLRDVGGFERLWLVYAFDRARPFSLTVVPYRDDRPHGVFATRAPSRPNPVGISAVRLLAVEDATLRVAGVDMLDGTPLLDIKPYVPEFDSYDVSRIGWLERGNGSMTADDRFEQDRPLLERTDDETPSTWHGVPEMPPDD